MVETFSQLYLACRESIYLNCWIWSFIHQALFFFLLSLPSSYSSGFLHSPVVVHLIKLPRKWFSPAARITSTWSPEFWCARNSCLTRFFGSCRCPMTGVSASLLVDFLFIIDYLLIIISLLWCLSAGLPVSIFLLLVEFYLCHIQQVLAWWYRIESDYAVWFWIKKTPF